VSDFFGGLAISYLPAIWCTTVFSQRHFFLINTSSALYFESNDFQTDGRNAESAMIFNDSCEPNGTTCTDIIPKGSKRTANTSIWMTNNGIRKEKIGRNHNTDDSQVPTNRTFVFESISEARSKKSNSGFDFRSKVVNKWSRVDRMLSKICGTMEGSYERMIKTLI
jgi:hypothetical protein